MELTLKILLGLYVLQGLIKLVTQFAVPYRIRIKNIARTYDGTFLKVFDNVLLALMAVFVVLLAMVGLEHLSFITGLVVGMTLMQLYFHRFDQPLDAEHAPPPPVTPIKSMSYAIQAKPSQAWMQIAIQMALLGWALVILIVANG